MKVMSLGLDPGPSSGGLAWTDGKTHGAQAFNKFDPDRFLSDLRRFLVMLQEKYPEHEFRVVLEEVWAQPPPQPTHCRKCGAKLSKEKEYKCPRCKLDNKRRMGAQSMFTFGRNLGRLEGLLEGLGIPCRLVKARKWQDRFNLIQKKRLTQTEKKNLNKECAERFFPEIKMTHYIADAMLISYYGYRTWR